MNICYKTVQKRPSRFQTLQYLKDERELLLKEIIRDELKIQVKSQTLNNTDFSILDLKFFSQFQ